MPSGIDRPQWVNPIMSERSVEFDKNGCIWSSGLFTPFYGFHDTVLNCLWACACVHFTLGKGSYSDLQSRDTGIFFCNFISWYIEMDNKTESHGLFGAFLSNKSAEVHWTVFLTDQWTISQHWLLGAEQALGPIFSLLLGVSSDYAQPITGQVTEVTCPVIGRAQPKLTLELETENGPRTSALNLQYSPVTSQFWEVIENRNIFFYISWNNFRVTWVYTFYVLTPLPLVPHICVGEMGQHWFR